MPPGTLHPPRSGHSPIELPDTQPWVNIYTMEVTSNECLSKVRSLLSCRSSMNTARSFQGNEAQTFIDFLDKVSKSCAQSFNNSRCQTQVLARSSLDENLRKRSLRLISKICKAHEIIPASYILQREFIRVGRVYYRGGFADVSKGEYFGRPVAIKRLKMNEGESERAFRVRLVKLAATVLLFRSHPAVMSGDYRLETSVPSEHPTVARGFCVRKLPLFPHPL